MILKLFNLYNEGREFHDDPVGKTFSVGRDMTSPVLFVPVLMCGLWSIIFGILSVIYHHWVVLALFWISVPVTLVWSGIYLLIHRMMRRVEHVAHQHVERFTSRDTGYSYESSRTIIDTSYNEQQ